jgi:hypothetical protein
MGQDGYSALTKNGQKSLKKHVFANFTFKTSYSTYEMGE